MSPLVILALVLILAAAINVLALNLAVIVPLVATTVCIAVAVIMGAYFASNVAALGSLTDFYNALQLVSYVVAWLLVAGLSNAIAKSAWAGELT